VANAGGFADIWNVIRQWPLLRITFLAADGANNQRLVDFAVCSSKIDLTMREHTIAARIGLGYTNREIANELCISERTVKAHVTRLLHKFGVDNRVKIASRLMLADQRPMDCSSLVQLSPREQRIAEMVAMGKTNWQIADAIGTTEQVVKNYLRGVFDKLGVWTRLELACRLLNRSVDVPGVQAIRESIFRNMPFHPDFPTPPSYAPDRVSVGGPTRESA
jgi:DNA-binding NarL/FixJ family response regulator